MGMLNVKIVGERMPGRTFDDHENVHVGIQRGADVVQLQPGDATSVKFTFGIVLRELEDGGLDFRSPFVHGKPGERFFYLSWGDVADDGSFEMFRRAKLLLSAVPPGLVTAKTGSIEAYLSMTDEKGGPVCASVKPPAVNWSTGG